MKVASDENVAETEAEPDPLVVGDALADAEPLTVTLTV